VIRMDVPFHLQWHDGKIQVSFMVWEFNSLGGFIGPTFDHNAFFLSCGFFFFFCVCMCEFLC
jgi:hypothetical protein